MPLQIKIVITTCIIGILILIGGIATKKKWLMLISIIPLVFSLGLLALLFIAISIIHQLLNNYFCIINYKYVVWYLNRNNLCILGVTLKLVFYCENKFLYKGEFKVMYIAEKLLILKNFKFYTVPMLAILNTKIRTKRV